MCVDGILSLLDEPLSSVILQGLHKDLGEIENGEDKEPELWAVATNELEFVVRSIGIKQQVVWPNHDDDFMDHFLDYPASLEMWTSLEVPYPEKEIKENQALDLDHGAYCVKAGNHDVEEEPKKEHWEVVQTRAIRSQVEACEDSSHFLLLLYRLELLSSLKEHVGWHSKDKREIDRHNTCFHFLSGGKWYFCNQSLLDQWSKNDALLHLRDCDCSEHSVEEKFVSEFTDFAPAQLSCWFDGSANGKNKNDEAANGTKNDELVELFNFLEEAFYCTFPRKILRNEPFSKVCWLDESELNQILEFFVVDLSIGWELHLLKVHVSKVLKHQVKQNYLIKHFLHEVLTDQLNYEQAIHCCLNVRGLFHEGLLLDICWQLSWNLDSKRGMVIWASSIISGSTGKSTSKRGSSVSKFETCYLGNK